MVITGGGWPVTTATVAIYDERGQTWSNIPPLNTARAHHACGGYKNEYKERVSVLRTVCYDDLTISRQVYVVVGGMSGPGTSDLLSSTEIFTEDGEYWTLFHSSLPAPLSHLRGVTVDNTVFITGHHYMQL